MKQIQLFRLISYLEGITYLLLLGIGVPLKYLYSNESWVKVLGMPHGLLFMAYIFFVIVLKQKYNWSNKTHLIVLLAAIIPFGTFYIDRKYLTQLS